MVYVVLSTCPCDKINLHKSCIQIRAEIIFYDFWNETKLITNIGIFSENQKDNIQKISVERDYFVEENRQHKQNIHSLNLKIKESKDNHALLGNELSLKSKLI